MRDISEFDGTEDWRDYLNSTAYAADCLASREGYVYVKERTDRCGCGRFMRWGGAWSASAGQIGKCGRCTILHDARTGWNDNGMTRGWAR